MNDDKLIQVETKKIVYMPENDGIDHINIWVRGKTELGRMLAHFYESPFEHPFYGSFNSMEGFWHFIRNKEHDDRLRSLSGMAAKNLGKEQNCCRIENFTEIINAANYYKIEQNARLKEMFVESTLPFTMYYLFTPKGDAEGHSDQVITNASHNWIVKGFEDNHTLMHYDCRPSFNDYKALRPEI